MDISVIIPCYNGNATLALQLEALSRQQDAPDFEVIVVDNRSTTPPDPIVEQWTGRVPNLRIVRATEGQGISVARNVGVREAASALVALCDADDAAGPTFVRAAFQGLAQADLVTGSVRLIECAEFEQGLDHVWALLAEATGGAADPYEALDFNHSDLDPTYPIMMGGACALRRDAVLALDGWDQAYFPGVEDNDFALRAVAAGYTIGFSHAMTLAERRRSTGGQAFKREFDGGLMHMKLCQGHDLWATSPHLNDPVWWLDLLKVPVAAAKMAAAPRDQRDFLGLGGRAGLRLGQAVGFWRHRIRRDAIVEQRGIGLR